MIKKSMDLMKLRINKDGIIEMIFESGGIIHKRIPSTALLKAIMGEFCREDISTFIEPLISRTYQKRKEEKRKSNE